ncbi:MAG: dockerin type I repeat-containing protein [Ruminococcus sp.]|nr:dockerin type I repeat-containing protein [Ruminococcus sp.]
MKRLLSVILCILIVVGSFSMLSTLVSAKEIGLAQTGYQILVTDYQQLKNLLYNSQNGEYLILQNDIIIDDNDNDNELILSLFTNCALDLNGYTLSRSTRGVDACLIRVNNGANFYVYDSSDEKSGAMIFSSGNYAGTSSVIIANGNVDIYGGNFEIKTPYQVGGGVVFLAETGYLEIFDGVFDSHTAFGGDTIELRHNAYMYDVPHCNIYDGTFYGKISNFEVSSFSDFSSYGCMYPSVYVFDGEFYIAQPDDEYAGFAYCNNGWGNVFVAGGTTYYKCLNSRDQDYLEGVSKNLTTIEYEGKKGYYYEITPPTMIGSEDLTLTDRLSIELMKMEVSFYSKKGAVYQNNQEMFDAILSYTDTIEVPAAIEESPLLWVENTDNVKTVSWYMSDQEHFDGKNTLWSELGDYRGSVLPFRFDFRPQEDTTLYIRCLITTDDGKELEDVIAIHYEEFKPNPPIASVEVAGVTAPSVGAKPDFSVDDTQMYYINGVYWTDVTTSSHINLKETDVFEAGHTYELQVWLRANDGYKFSTDSDDWLDITATIGGKEAEAIGNEIAAILTVTYTLSDEEKPTESQDPEEYLLGDVDGDGKVSVVDATLVQRHVAKLTTLEATQLLAADTYKDGEITVVDATTIQRFVAKLITEF